MSYVDKIDEFKKVTCDENRIIPVLLRDHFLDYFEGPIVDVGSGLGDILSEVIPDKKVIHIDLEDYSRHELPESHQRVQGDFFSFKEKSTTLFMSHILQYIDDDIDLLNNRIQQISPKYIISITNTNQDVMGELISWFDENNIKTNPERIIDSFPAGYIEVFSKKFTAQIKASSFEKLSEQLGIIIFDSNLEQKDLERFKVFLEKRLKEPGFLFEEQITVYENQY